MSVILSSKISFVKTQHYYVMSAVSTGLTLMFSEKIALYAVVFTDISRRCKNAADKSVDVRDHVKFTAWLLLYIAADYR